MNHIAGKAQAFYEASQPYFEKYAGDVVSMAKLMANIFTENKINVITGGTDSHIVLIGTDNKTGKEIANTLEDRYNIIVNKNTIPNDNRSVFETSGIRIGTAAMVTKHGADSNYFSNIAEKIVKVIKE